uniref:Uncharacterized protein n=1 Tax=Anguilla anguilla TaxID=7936 RepID=A0A0E9RDG7_ANGAN
MGYSLHRNKMSCVRSVLTVLIQL